MSSAEARRGMGEERGEEGGEAAKAELERRSVAPCSDRGWKGQPVPGHQTLFYRSHPISPTLTGWLPFARGSGAMIVAARGRDALRSLEGLQPARGLEALPVAAWAVMGAARGLDALPPHGGVAAGLGLEALPTAARAVKRGFGR